MDLSEKRILPGVGEEMLQREGLSPQPQPWEDGLRADAAAGAFEWWYFDAAFEDGSTAVIVFMTKPLLERKGPLAPAVTLTITPPGGEKLSVLQSYPASEFSASRQSCDVRIGNNRACGDLQRYELHASAGGLEADLVFSGLVPAWRPGAGKNYFSQDLQRYFAWLPAIPYGSAEGVLTYQGKTVHVRGSGYHDHNWGNVDLNAVMSHWYWGRAHLGDFTTIFVEQVARPDYGQVKMPVFLLAHQERILTGDGAPLTLKTQDFQPHPGGRAYPMQLDFHWETGEGCVHLALRQPEIIEAASLLGTLPPWKRAVARLLANPYYFRFRADLELSVELAGFQQTLNGPAIYELMLLR